MALSLSSFLQFILVLLPVHHTAHLNLDLNLEAPDSEDENRVDWSSIDEWHGAAHELDYDMVWVDEESGADLGADEGLEQVAVNEDDGEAHAHEFDLNQGTEFLIVTTKYAGNERRRCGRNRNEEVHGFIFHPGEQPPHPPLGVQRKHT